ncbi:MAG: hypothetical protein Q8R16_01635 [bacterium]|nr:hypothetical protein [bacterium]
MSRMHAARRIRTERRQREDRRWFSDDRPAPLPRDRSPIVFVRCPNYLRHCGQTARKLAFYGHDGQEMRVTHAFAVRRSALERFLACCRMDDHPCFHEVQPAFGERTYALRWSEVQTFVNGEGCQQDVSPTVLRFHPAHAAQMQMVERDDRIRWGGLSFGCDCCNHSYWERDVDVHYQAVFAPRPIAFVRGRPVS